MEDFQYQSAIQFASFQNIQDNLCQFNLSLNHDKEILKICEKQINFDQNNAFQDLQEKDRQKLRQLLRQNIEKLDEELKQLEQFENYINLKKSSLNSTDLETFNMIKLRVNKLQIQIEKIYSAHTEFSKISSQLPRPQAKSNQIIFTKKSTEKLLNNEIVTGDLNYLSSKTLQSPEKNISFQPQQNIRNNSSSFVQNTSFIQAKIPQTNQNAISASSRALSPPQRLSPQIKLNTQENERRVGNQQKKDYSTDQTLNDKNGLQFIKRELMGIKENLIEMKKELDQHDHSEYETELEFLKQENSRNFKNYQILKQDNSEILHSIAQINKAAAEIAKQNQQIFQSIQQITGSSDNLGQASATFNNKNINSRRDNASSNTNYPFNNKNEFASQMESNTNRENFNKSQKYSISEDYVNANKESQKYLIPKKEIEEKELMSSWAKRKLENI